MPSIINDYQCRDNLYHDYSDLVADTKAEQVERCVRCGHKLIFYKAVNGRIDNVKYARTHELETMQPEHKEWSRYYGKYKGKDQVHDLQLKPNKR